MIEATGRGTWKCLFDVPPHIPPAQLLKMTKKDVYDSRQIEFTTQFLQKHGEEIQWNQPN